MTAATARKPAGRPAGGRSKLDKIATFRRVEEGVRVYACRGCQRDMQPDTRKPGTPRLADVLRHDCNGYCGSCHVAIRNTGKPHPVGGPRSAGAAPAGDEHPERSGICECGCGRQTAVATRTVRRLGQYRGVRNRFLAGHSATYRHARDEPAAPAAPEPVVEPEHVWKTRAECRLRGSDPRDFEMPDGWRGQGPTPEAVIAARRYCARCPVLVECGELAEQLNDAAAWPVVGLWGGEWRSHVGTESIRTAGPVPDPAGDPVAAGAA